jgi:short-subunit dehydrogenase
LWKHAVTTLFVATKVSPMPFPPQDRPVVVITGASAGIGRATAVEFARQGYSVGIVARGRDRLESARRDLEALGARVFVAQADVANADALQEAADRVAEAFGGIHVWINNAMASVFGPVSTLTPEEIRRVTDVTYLGQVHGTLAALRHMRRDDQGTIVQIGSALSYRSIPLQSAYCAAKFAARGFTDSLRTELEHEDSGIRLTMVQLPAVNTPQFDWARNHTSRRLQPVPPIHDPEPIARAIRRAAEEAPRELWVGAPTIEAILGTMVAPGLLDRYMARKAWDGQMTAAAEPPRGDNLFEPIAGDPGARGRFSDRARPTVVAVSGTVVRGALLAALAGGLAGAAALGWLVGARTHAYRRPRLERRGSSIRASAR